jgi:hypothetical protein
LVKSLETPTIALRNVVEEVVVAERRAAAGVTAAAGERVQRVVRVHATNVYVKTPAGWKMVLHHASAAPEGELSESSEETKSHGVLH